jgi:putative spermidine/putrescine transport system ATP-binding protein
MDEPLGALDKQLREEMQLRDHAYPRSGSASRLSTSRTISREALTMSDRVAVFNQRQSSSRLGAADRRSTRSRPTASSPNFIGENNALEGTVVAVAGEECDVRLDCGTVLRARTGNVGAGGRARIAVRPERVQLAGEGEGANRLDATVRELIYLGDQIRLRVELAGKHEFTIKAPISQLDRSLRPGDAIRVGLDPAHTRALDVPAAH